VHKNSKNYPITEKVVHRITKSILVDSSYKHIKLIFTTEMRFGIRNNLRYWIKYYLWKISYTENLTHLLRICWFWSSFWERLSCWCGHFLRFLDIRIFQGWNSLAGAWPNALYGKGQNLHGRSASEWLVLCYENGQFIKLWLCKKKRSTVKSQLLDSI